MSETWGIGIRHLVLPIGLGLIVVGMISWENRRGGLHLPQWATQLGNASYGIYLLHITVIRSVVALVSPETELPTGLFSLLSIGCVLAIAMPFGLAEHRVYGRLARMLSSGGGR